MIADEATTSVSAAAGVVSSYISELNSISRPSVEESISHAEGLNKPATLNTNTFVSPEALKGFPKAGPRTSTIKPRQKRKSTISTSTPERILLEINENQKSTQKRKIIKRVIESSSEDENDDPIHFYDDDSTDGDCYETVDTFDYPDRDILINDFVLVKFFEENKAIYYVGEV